MRINGLIGVCSGGGDDDGSKGWHKDDVNGAKILQEAYMGDFSSLLSALSIWTTQNVGWLAQKTTERTIQIVRLMLQYIWHFEVMHTIKMRVERLYTHKHICKQ